MSCAGVGVWLLPLAATPDRAHDDLDRQPEDDQVGDHLPCDDEPRSLALSCESPNPTVENTVTVKYSASVRVSVEEAAARMGYSERSAFSHAFKRWSGRSPESWHRSTATTDVPLTSREVQSIG